MKKVVVIGGGTGVFTVLVGLKDFPYNLSAIVSIADDGGSSRVLREDFGILPPGDIRRALIALSSTSPLLTKLFSYRFKDGNSLKGHSFGNLFLTALERITGDFSKAIKEAGKILNIKGEVIPVSLENARLFAQLGNGYLVVGETNIDIPKHDPNLKIEKVFLNPRIPANPKAIKAIKEADAIILGPGDLYSSIVPNLLVDGIPQAIKRSKAKKIYVCNIMTKYGETNNFTVEDFCKAIEKYLGRNVIDYVVVNTEKISQKSLKKYSEEKAQPVELKDERFFKERKYNLIKASLLRKTKFLRHDPQKLAKILADIIG